MEAASPERLKISGLAEAAGVPVATVRHYLREGLLPEGEKTSRNMAYYSPDLVERIKLIKQLQEDRFMPLRVIGELLERAGGDESGLRAVIESDTSLLERALETERGRTSLVDVIERHGVPEPALKRLAELGILTPDAKGYSPSDVRIVEAISRFRAGGYDERIGFTVHDVERFVEPLTDLARREVALLSEKISGRFEPERAEELLAAGLEPLSALVSALHSKMLAAEASRLTGE